MEDDEKLEETRLAESVRLVAPTLVKAIDEDHRHSVHTRDCNRNAHVQQLVVELRRDVEGLVPCRLGDHRSGDGCRELAGRELQEGRRRQADANDGWVRLAVDGEVVHGRDAIRAT